jgi:hypothetical protein
MFIIVSFRGTPLTNPPSALFDRFVSAVVNCTADVRCWPKADAALSI